MAVASVRDDIERSRTALWWSLILRNETNLMNDSQQDDHSDSTVLESGEERKDNRGMEDIARNRQRIGRGRRLEARSVRWVQGRGVSAFARS